MDSGRLHKFDLKRLPLFGRLQDLMSQTFLKPHSHPNGFIWEHQCSWTLTIANSMQVTTSPAGLRLLYLGQNNDLLADLTNAEKAF